MWVYYNNEVIPENELKLSVFNRSFQYGDGFFETIGYKNGQIRFLEDHIHRIKRGAKVLKLNLDAKHTSVDYLTETIMSLIEKNNCSLGASIKMIVWRAEGGKYLPESDSEQMLIYVQPKSWGRQIIRHQNVGVFDKLINTYSPFSSIKSTSSANYVSAGIYKKENKFDEVILLGEGESLSECLFSNLLWIEKGVLYTPSYLTGCVDGVMKKQLFKACIKRNITFQEGVFGVNELNNAEYVFTSNVFGFAVIQQFEKNDYQKKHDVFDEITDELK